MQVKGSVAVIIGAAHGIGRAVVEKLLQLGAKVAFGDDDEEVSLTTLKEFQTKYGEDGVFFQKCDITQKSDIKGLLEATISRWGRIDIFSPVAGIQHETNWESSIEVNLIGNIQSVNEVMKHMSKEEGGKGGVIVIFSSIQAFWVFAYAPVYRGTKGALLCYGQSMAANFGHHGIRFNIMCPGAIAGTRNEKWLMEDKGERWLYADEARDFVSKDLGTDCWAQPSSVAAAFVHFVEDETMKGQALLIEKEGGNDVIKKLTFNVTTELLEKIKAE